MVQLYEVVGYYLMQPISTLLDELETASPEVPHYHTPAFLISGYAAAIVPLAVTMVESFIYHGQNIMWGEVKEGHPTEFVHKAYPESGFAGKLAELRAVRHAILHSHIWQREMKWDLNATPPRLQVELGPFELQDEFGHKHSFRKWVNLQEMRTRDLGISIVPTRLERDDAKVVLNTAVDFLLFLDEKVAEKIGREKGMPLN